jgi:hypothetical protein
VGGSTFIGFWVNSLEVALAALEQIGARVLCEHQHRRCGYRIVFADPDGRAVEINQRDHRPASPEASLRRIVLPDFDGVARRARYIT